jgi:flagella basal body P-ring formation protein FlgA
MLLASAPLYAQVVNPGPNQGLTDTRDVQRAAEDLVTRRVSTGGATTRLFVSAGALDARLRLPLCAAPLEGFLPTGAQPAARTTVGVRCTTPSWTVYVPVSVESETRVLVLRRAAPRLAALTTADVEPQLRRVPGFPTTYLSEVGDLAGRHLRLAAAPGTPLTADLLARDLIVKRGQRVTLLTRVGGIEVSAAGEAMADATPEGRVRVQNLASRRVVEGVAETADRVRVGP